MGERGGVLTRPGEHDGGIDADVPVRPMTQRTTGDRIFRVVATGATSVSLIIVAITFIFLANGSRPALASSGIWNFFTGSVWNPTVGHFGVLGLLEGTLIIATIAMVIALPLALAMALFINEYAPARLRRILTSVIDLLAALPSLLFGSGGSTRSRVSWSRSPSSSPVTSPRSRS